MWLCSPRFDISLLSLRASELPKFLWTTGAPSNCGIKTWGTSESPLGCEHHGKPPVYLCGTCMLLLLGSLKETCPCNNLIHLKGKICYFFKCVFQPSKVFLATGLSQSSDKREDLFLCTFWDIFKGPELFFHLVLSTFLKHPYPWPLNCSLLHVCGFDPVKGCFLSTQLTL